MPELIPDRRQLILEPIDLLQHRLEVVRSETDVFHAPADLLLESMGDLVIEMPNELAVSDRHPATQRSPIEHRADLPFPVPVHDDHRVQLVSDLEPLGGQVLPQRIDHKGTVVDHQLDRPRMARPWEHLHPHRDLAPGGGVQMLEHGRDQLDQLLIRSVAEEIGRRATQQRLGEGLQDFNHLRSRRLPDQAPNPLQRLRGRRYVGLRIHRSLTHLDFPQTSSSTGPRRPHPCPGLQSGGALQVRSI